VDGATFPARNGLGGQNLALSATRLGASVTYNQSTFPISTVTPYNAISAVGQLLRVAGTKAGAKVLNILAVAVNGNQPDQTITLNYTDAVPQTIKQSFSSWTTPQNYFGEAIAAVTSHADRADGTQVPGTFYVYGYTIPLTGNLESITLPNNPN